MMATMIYAVVIAALLGMSAAVTERMLAELRWPRRTAWMLALVASVALPTWALLPSSDAGTSSIVSLPFRIELPLQVPAGDVTAAPSGSEAAPGWQFPVVSDSLLRWLWTASSAFMLLLIATAAFRLHLAVRQATRTNIAGRDVYLSDRFGPAILGFFRPRVVLPRWLAQDDSNLRSLVLKHEWAHVAARDQLLLLAALLIVAAMPWNLPLWWQLRRLRASIEVDCDSRVLREGADALKYSEALYSVREHHAGAPLGAVAMTEPVSDLERRIRIMMDKARQFSVSRTGLHLGVLSLLVGVTLAINAPRAQQAAADESDATPDAVSAPMMSERVYQVLSRAEECLSTPNPGPNWACAHGVLNELHDDDSLSPYEEAQYWNTRGYIYIGQDNFFQAAESYAQILPLEGAVSEHFIGDTQRTLAQLYHQQGRHLEAYELLRRSLGLDEDMVLTNFGVSDGEVLPRVSPPPPFPDEARLTATEGHVVVEFTVNRNGNTENIRVVGSSSPVFEDAAVEAAGEYRYRPRVVDGEAVDTHQVLRRVDFELP